MQHYHITLIHGIQSIEDMHDFYTHITANANLYYTILHQSLVFFVNKNVEKIVWLRGYTLEIDLNVVLQEYILQYCKGGAVLSKLMLISMSCGNSKVYKVKEQKKNWNISAYLHTLTLTFRGKKLELTLAELVLSRRFDARAMRSLSMLRAESRLAWCVYFWRCALSFHAARLFGAVRIVNACALCLPTMLRIKLTLVLRICLQRFALIDAYTWFQVKQTEWRSDRLALVVR